MHKLMKSVPLLTKGRVGARNDTSQMHTFR